MKIDFTNIKAINWTKKFHSLGKASLILFLLFLVVKIDESHAEGSGDWGTATNRQSMLWVPGNQAVSGLTVRGSMMVPSGTPGYNAGHRLYVYVKQGETVFWGFRRSGSTGNIRVRWFYDATSSGFFPQGTSGTSRSFHGGYEINPSDAGGGFGRPADGLAAYTGPTQVTGTGYTGLSFINDTGADRAFWVEISGTDDLIIPSGFNINFWDITTASGTPGNYTEQKGRVYSRYWSTSNSRSNAAQNNLMIQNKGQADAYSFHQDFGFYVPIDNTYTAATNDYFVKRIKFDGSSGGWTNFFANQDGPRNHLSFEENRKSIAGTSSNNYQYPLFINDPDPSIWASTTPPSAVLNIIYSEKAAPATGGEANVNINISLPAIVDILIDINGNGEFDNTDVILSAIYESPGNYAIYWNGEDANGVELPSGGEVNFIASVAFFPVHFPIFDLEQNLGIEVTNIRPGDVANDFIFWDDSNIPRTGLTPSDSPQSIAVNVTGVESPEHIWWATGDNGFSNNITINTWTASFYRVVQRTSGFTFLSISGNVYEDLNALTDNRVNGTGVNIPDFYAVLIDGANNVVSFGTIQNDGTYVINDVPNGTFSIMITTQLPTLGQLAPDLVLPLYYESTGENLGSGEGSDGLANSILPNIVVNNASLTDANFGIRPIEYDLVVTKDANAFKPHVGDEINFTITVSNQGYSVAREVFLTENMPVGYQYVSHVASQGIYDPFSDPGLWNIGTLESWQTVTLTITVEVLESTDYFNSVVTYSATGIPETNDQNNYADADTEPISALPVDWLSFDGKLRQESVHLHWSTAKERYSDHFLIQRSQDIQMWVNIGEVQAHGFTDQVTNYEWFDRMAVIGINYYRLAQFDLDGTHSYSKVIRVDFHPTWDVKVYPNPFMEYIFIKGKDLKLFSWTLSDYSGRILQNSSGNSLVNEVRLETGELNSGLYFLKLQNSTETFIYKLKKN